MRYHSGHILIDVRVVLEQNGNILKLEVLMILTPALAVEVGEALIDAAQNSNPTNNNKIDVVVVSNNKAVSMPSHDGGHGYQVVHQIRS